MGSEFFNSSRLGAHFGDIGFDQFPEKYEVTPIFEDDNQMEHMWRNTLKDFTPDLPLHSSDFARRSYDGHGRLTLRHTGTRSGLDPENPDLFLGFTDRDPRGHLLEPNGEEWKRYHWHRKGMFEPGFKDDSDYSVPSAGIHPNTMYPAMRRTQDWAKARLKIFSTAKDGWQHGGRVEIPHASLVNRVESGDENMSADLIHLNPEFRRHRSTVLSNNFISGYRSTTDHEFDVASYGKLFRGTPLMDHQSQVSYVNPDHALSAMALDEGQQVPRLIVALMAAQVSDNRANRQLSGEQIAPHLGGLQSSPALEATNRGFRLSDDIRQLLGYVAYEMKQFGDARHGMAGGSGLAPGQDLVALKRLSQLLHSQPAHVKLGINRLVEQAYAAAKGAGVPRGDLVGLKRESMVNPKIVEFMVQQTRTGKGPEEGNLREGIAQPTSTHQIEGLEMYVSTGKGPERGNLLEGLVEENQRENITSNLEIPQYGQMIQHNVLKNKRMAESDVIMGNTDHALMRRLNHQSPGIHLPTDQDTLVREFGVKDRMGGHMGTKYMRRYMDTDTMHGDLSETTMA